MKKTFPLIVVLITISLLGIIFIQISWINNSYEVQRQVYAQKISRVLSTVSEAIIREKQDKLVQISGGSSLFPVAISVKKIFTNFEIKDLIKKELRLENAKDEFEYCITDEQFLAPVMNSSGFKKEFFENKDISSPILVSPENSTLKEYLYVYFYNPEMYVTKKMFYLIVSSLLFTIVIISAFVLTVRTLLKQKKISEIKNDFIANMTHEFKTPLATISIATDMLRNVKVKNDHEKMDYYTEIIKEENKRMNAQVETILQSAQLEKQEIKLTLKRINVHEVINNVYDNTNLQVEEKHGNLSTHLNASNPFIRADEVHFSNIIFNLLDNAIKYSKENLDIKIETENIGNTLLIRFTDNGIGMSKDTINNIFEKFYRAHTGNLHNVKGFGLGLTYVRQIVDAHEGKIKVQSVLGKGSTFTLSFNVIVS
jgi:two-component system, OmpR family, phosphate regulon sensor histidine kinase PhoR